MLVGWMLSILTKGSISYGIMFESAFPGAPQTQLAMFHTFFNVITVLIMLPLTGVLVSLVCKMIPQKDSSDAEVLKLKYVDNNMLRTPPLAVAQSKREIMGMAEMAMENFDRAVAIITTLDFKERELFNKVEEKINFINRTLVDFVVRLSNGSCTPVTGILYLELSSDSERIADHLINVAKTIRSLKR